MCVMYASGKVVTYVCCDVYSHRYLFIALYSTAGTVRLVRQGPTGENTIHLFVILQEGTNVN